MFSLVCPFLNESADYANGVELGMLYARLKRKRQVRDYFLLSNQDQILLLASRLNFEVVEMESHDESWFWLVLRRRG